MDYNPGFASSESIGLEINICWNDDYTLNCIEWVHKLTFVHKNVNKKYNSWKDTLRAYQLLKLNTEIKASGYFLNYENMSKFIICECISSQTYTHPNMLPTLWISKKKRNLKNKSF